MVSGMAPQAIKMIDGSTFRMALANWLCLYANWFGFIAPYWYVMPHISLPMPQNFT
jgi:hypothetical protein